MKQLVLPTVSRRTSPKNHQPPDWLKTLKREFVPPSDEDLDAEIAKQEKRK